MKDLQAVFIRDIAPLNQINFIAVLRIEVEDTSGITGVKVNGLDAKFVRDPNGRVVYARLPAGTSQMAVSSVKLQRTAITPGGTTSYMEDVDIGEGAIDPLLKPDPTITNNPMGVTFFGGMLQLTGSDFTQVQRVKVNNLDMPFTVVSKSEIICTIPENSPTIDQVDVITSATTVSRRTYFEYMVGADVQAVQGAQKLIQQFIKLLMTSKGSDIFNPGRGGSLQEFVGTNFAADNPTSLVAQITMRIVQCGFEMAMMQGMAGIPDDERLISVDVLGIEADPNDPTILQLSIRLNIFSGTVAEFSTIIGGVVDKTIDTATSLVQAAQSY